MKDEDSFANFKWFRVKKLIIIALNGRAKKCKIIESIKKQFPRSFNKFS